jgi:putative membrane protein
MNSRKFIVNSLKGFSLGAGVFPGVSAGTIALMTGIFAPLIDSLNSILSISNWKMLFKGDFKGFWKGINGGLLLPVTIGMILGFLILAKFVAWSLSYYPIPAWSFFFGLILVSTIWLLSDIKGWKIADVIWLAIGIGIGVTLCLIKQPDQNNPNTAYWYTCLSGIVAICSMIFPGISGSFILVMFGNFNYMLNVLNGTVSYVLGGSGTAQWGPLLVFILGCLIGIIAFSKFLHWLLEKHGRPTMLVLFGLVLGFLVAIWPWADKVSIAAAQLMRTGDTLGAEAIRLSSIVPAGMDLNLQIPWAIAFFILGAAFVVVIEFFSRKK